MLDLEVVPERSLGNEQWEFILGESPEVFISIYVVTTVSGNDVAHQCDTKTIA